MIDHPPFQRLGSLVRRIRNRGPRDGVIGLALATSFPIHVAGAAPVDLSADLAEIRREFGVPSLATVVFSSKEILAEGADGERRAGSGARVTISDKFHVGSITKSMTGTLAAILVEDGTLDWKTALGEAAPDIRMHADVRGITLEQLLRHRSGLDRDIPDRLFAKLRLRDERPATQRERLAREMLKAPPKSKPDSTFEYSNAGYTFAGLILERRARTPWEKLITEKLFAPLGMKSAGFGPPAKDARDLDQPWGHTADGSPVEPGPEADNIPAIGPAGTAHMSLRDLARYGQWHLRENGPIEPPLIKPQALRFLHGTGKPDGYHFGWNRYARDWAGGQALSHNGSNTMFFAVIWLAPARDFGMVAAANQGGEKAERACDAAASLAVGRFGVDRGTDRSAPGARKPDNR